MTIDRHTARECDQNTRAAVILPIVLHVSSVCSWSSLAIVMVYNSAGDGTRGHPEMDSFEPHGKELCYSHVLDLLTCVSSGEDTIRQIKSQLLH